MAALLLGAVGTAIGGSMGGAVLGVGEPQQSNGHSTEGREEFDALRA